MWGLLHGVVQQPFPEGGVRMGTLGLYFHIPFCLAKCAYCDFCSFPATDEDLRHRYARALIRELAARAEGLGRRTVDTVFFGGGTPTLLSPRDLCAILDEVRACFALTPDAEITVECNPKTADLDALRALRAGGVNRLSIGMQSANDEELAALGRAHRQEDLLRAVQDARAAGFENINLDLMFGIPHQTEKSFARTLSEAISLAPAHLSVYSLQIEPGTPFYENRDKLPLPSEDDEAALSAMLHATLRAAGYERYEISNWAKAGRECRHNLRYWRMQDYLGLGIASHSLIGNERFYNRESLTDYLTDPLSLREREEMLSDAEREFEYVMLGLRLGCGIGEDEFRAAFGYGFFEKYGARLGAYLAAGLAVFDGARTRLTDGGMAVSNALLAEILD